MRQKTQALRKTLTNLHNRTARKLANQQKELEATFDREHLRRLGDIVTANLHVISRGQARLTAVDFYDPEMKEIDIPLNPAISPQQNAAKFYKDYQKAKKLRKRFSPSRLQRARQSCIWQACSTSCLVVRARHADIRN